MTVMQASRLRFRLGSLGRARPALGHELVELPLVLGLAQAVEELDELALLLLQPPQRLFAILVEGAVAAGRAVPAPGALESVLALVVPAAHLAMRPTGHASSPYEISEDQQADRPIGHEAQDHEGDPDRLGDLLQLGGDIHGEPHVNVTYIYMPSPAAVVKESRTQILFCQHLQAVERLPPVTRCPGRRARSGRGPAGRPARPPQVALRPTSARCAGRRRRGRTARRCRATAPRCAAPSS